MSAATDRRGTDAAPDEAAAFAEAVGIAADQSLAPPVYWRPGSTGVDRCPALADALARIGWHELGADPALAPLAGPAALALGRRLAPLCELDVLLGGSPLAGDLIRYGGDGARAIELRADGALALHEVMRSEPVAYGDAQGVHRVLELRAAGAVEPAVAATRLTAWTAAGTGYLAGISEWALELTVEYVRGRRAFGSTLAALPPVQQRLADAATASRGLSLLAHDAPGRAALAHAGAAAVDVTAACQQLVGAIGFTLELPLQRAFRRARAMQLWADAFLG
jgi:hypothetical protein